MTLQSISPCIPLTLGIIAGTLFLLVLGAAYIVTMRNRKIIRRNTEYCSSEQ